jgi:HSF-type DNA-binding
MSLKQEETDIHNNNGDITIPTDQTPIRLENDQDNQIKDTPSQNDLMDVMNLNQNERVAAESSPQARKKKASAEGSGGQSLQFPFKLHEMLKLAEETGREHVISWMPEGRGFKVHNKEAFCEHIMPLFFASNKYKTFQRSLNLW